MSSVILTITEFKEQFDLLLARELDRHIQRAGLFTKDQDCAALLMQVKEIALAGGKRIRPYVSYLMYRTAGGEMEGDTSTVLETLVAFEIFHTFALVHDDIIDKGVLRHGKPTLHEFARAFAHGSREKAEHLANGLALLAGDLAFNWSRETFLRSTPPAEAQKLFDDMVYAVVLGQMLDVKIMCQENPPESMIMEKTFLKTAEYTFVYPMRIGAALAGDFDTYTEWCKKIGTSLGIAFQIQDDLFDIVGDERSTGKKTLQDNAEGQHTVFTAYVRAHGTVEDVKIFNDLFGRTLDEESSLELKNIYERSGAIAYGKNVIETEINNAKQLLEELSENSDATAAWSKLIQQMEKRLA